MPKLNRLLYTERMDTGFPSQDSLSPVKGSFALRTEWHY